MAQNSVVGAERRRGRPRQFDEAQVLEAARDVFWNNGYAATSLDDLAAATGLNRPSLHAAFGDKRAIYLRALEENRSWMASGIRQRLTGKIPLRSALSELFMEAITGTLAGDVGARGCFVVCTAVTEALRNTETRAVAAGFIADTDQIFRERFERSPQELNAGISPATAAAVASAMLHTIAVRARTGSDRDELAGIASAAVIAICGPADAEARS